MPMTPCGKLEQLARHDLLEAVDARDAVADREDRADLGEVGLLSYPSICWRMILLISSTLICMPAYSSAIRRSKPIELRSHAAVEDVGADLGHDAADERRIYPMRKLHAATRQSLESSLHALLEVRRKGHGRGQGRRDDAPLGFPHLAKDLGDRGKRRGAAVIGDGAEKVLHDLRAAVGFGESDENVLLRG